MQGDNMSEFSVNSLLNILALLVPVLLLITVILLKKNQTIGIDPSCCAKTWERFISIIIDLVICLAAVWGIQLLTRKIGLIILSDYIEVTFFLFSWLYFALLESSNMRGSIGKLAQGIVVVDLNGERISFIRATIRFFSTLLSDMSIFLGYIMIIFTKHKQGLHDMIANTLVLNKQMMHDHRD